MAVSVICGDIPPTPSTLGYLLRGCVNNWWKGCHKWADGSTEDVQLKLNPCKHSCIHTPPEVEGFRLWLFMTLAITTWRTISDLISHLVRRCEQELMECNWKYDTLAVSTESKCIQEAIGIHGKSTLFQLSMGLWFILNVVMIIVTLQNTWGG